MQWAMLLAVVFILENTANLTLGRYTAIPLLVYVPMVIATMVDLLIVTRSH